MNYNRHNDIYKRNNYDDPQHINYMRQKYIPPPHSPYIFNNTEHQIPPELIKNRQNDGWITKYVDKRIICSCIIMLLLTILSNKFLDINISSIKSENDLIDMVIEKGLSLSNSKTLNDNNNNDNNNNIKKKLDKIEKVYIDPNLSKNIKKNIVTIGNIKNKIKEKTDTDLIFIDEDNEIIFIDDINGDLNGNLNGNEIIIEEESEDEFIVLTNDNGEEFILSDDNTMIRIENDIRANRGGSNKKIYKVKKLKGNKSDHQHSNFNYKNIKDAYPSPAYNKPVDEPKCKNGRLINGVCVCPKYYTGKTCSIRIDQNLSRHKNDGPVNVHCNYDYECERRAYVLPAKTDNLFKDYYIDPSLCNAKCINGLCQGTHNVKIYNVNS